MSNLIFISFCTYIVCRFTAYLIFVQRNAWCRRSQWPRGLRRRSAAARLLRLWVRIPPGAWMFVCCVCCVLSGRGLCDELITRPEESYRLWCVVVCDLESSWMRRTWPTGGCRTKKQTIPDLTAHLTLMTPHTLNPRFAVLSHLACVSALTACSSETWRYILLHFCYTNPGS